MTNDEIRKLLGGYATNTLTETERKTLFDAALDDQELFNALQDEEALKELLADPVTRAQLQRALEEPARPREAWWHRRWAWAGAASAVAAAVLIVGVVRMNSTSQKNSTSPKMSQQVASVDAVKAPATEPAAVAEKDKALEPIAPKASLPAKERRSMTPPAGAPLTRSDSRASSAGASGFRDEKKAEAVSNPSPAAPPPPPSASAPPKEVAQQVQIQNQALPGQGGPSQNNSQELNSANRSFATPAPATRDQLRSTDGLPIQGRSAGLFGGAASSGSIAPLRYAVLRRDNSGAYVPVTDGLKAGDEVKLSVTTVEPGVLSLDHLDASGAPSRFFPATGPGLAVLANTSYTIPNSPIEVKDTDQKFRVNLSPQVAQPEAAAETAGRFGASATKAKSALAKPQLKQSTAPSIEITIGPKRTP
jgi:PHD/YefM family antitoxin component YafN of YafNO toxin-antitoxin module